jgi:hypothetical protein
MHSATMPTYRKGEGWILFAAIMLAISAALDAVWGIAAVSRSRFFLGDATFIVSDLHTWGWITIGFAVLQALAAVSVLRGGAYGRWFGIAVAGLATIVAMMSIRAYPFWSLALVATYLLVIYGLATYGGKPEPSRT